MSFLDRLFGRTPDPAATTRMATRPQPVRQPDPDQVAVERYRYLLRTAPPDDVERAHVEAFERLSPEQRAIVRRDLEGTVPAGEAPQSDDPQVLARAATRAELRQPGTLERSFGASQGPGMAGSFLQTFAAVFVATSAAQLLFGSFGDPYADGGASATGGDEAGTGASDDASGYGSGPDSADSDVGDFGGDVGGDFGDFGGFDI